MSLEKVDGGGGEGGIVVCKMGGILYSSPKTLTHIQNKKKKKFVHLLFQFFQ